jgi:mannan endo-1,4-beta-mannosidase
VQLHGSGAPKELFYVDLQLKGYYKSYVAAVINHTNSVNGRAYRDDPAVLAWEVRAGRGAAAAARVRI